MFLRELSDNSKKLFLELEMLLVHADGDFSKQEEKLVNQHCAEMGIDPIPYDESVELEEIIGNINNTMTAKEKKIIFIELITVAIIDGVYDNREKEIVESLRNLLKIPVSVSEQAFSLVKKLVDTSTEIENFVEW